MTAVDLSIMYLGLKLKNPIVASSSPLMEEIDNIRSMEEAGAAAVVLHSLFEEQLQTEAERIDRFLSYGSESYAESTSYFPDLTTYNLGPERYLNHIQKAKKAVAIPVIASLNGTTDGGWLQFAQQIEQAGADALELNIYNIPTNPALTAQEIEKRYIDLVQHLKANLRIPLAVKLHPFFSSLPHMARSLSSAGADGLVLFNRFYQPDFDLETMDVVPTLTLSTPTELLLRLHWVGILYGRVPADLAITGGVHTAKDVVKCLVAGAKVAMMTSALLKYRIQHISTVLNDLLEWLTEREYQSVAEMIGSMSQLSVVDPESFERANYVRVLSSYRTRK